MAKMRQSLHLEQGRFVGTFDRSEEVLLELTIPMTFDRERFRIGWSLKGLGRTGWIAISTGEERWSPGEMELAAQHIRYLLEASWDLIYERRDVSLHD